MDTPSKQISSAELTGFSITAKTCPLLQRVTVKKNGQVFLDIQYHTRTAIHLLVSTALVVKVKNFATFLFYCLIGKGTSRGEQTIWRVDGTVKSAHGAIHPRDALQLFLSIMYLCFLNLLSSVYIYYSLFCNDKVTCMML